MTSRKSRRSTEGKFTGPITTPEQREGGHKKKRLQTEIERGSKNIGSDTETEEEEQENGKQHKITGDAREEIVQSEEEKSEKSENEENGIDLKTVETILENKNDINKATIRETGGKISFSRSDQQSVRQATQEFTEMLTRLVFEVGKQEVEICKIKGQVEIWKERATKTARSHQNQGNAQFPGLGTPQFPG
ncbi:hypothetical protein JTB14_018826 [Gonioctena quinquepunctata]|nr:hypothetical protein JTB14_018826 [Gonioctena quinquepunctata]